MVSHLGRCWFFWLWAFVGGALLLSVLSVIGVFTAIPALVALFLVGRRSPRWPEPLGLFAGFGGLCVTIAALNWGHEGVDRASWLAAGVGLMLAGALGYSLALGPGSPRTRRR